MPIKIKSTSGSVTLDAQNVSGDQTITVPSLAGGKTLLTTDGDGSSLTGVGVDGIVSTANATAITIDSNENVGIGTTAPDQKIHVEGAGDVYVQVESSDHNKAGVKFIRDGSYADWAIFDDGGILKFNADADLLSGAGTTRLSLLDTGNMGLGVTPSTWHSDMDVIEFTTGSISTWTSGASDADFVIANNAYYDSTNTRWQHKGVGEACFIGMKDGIITMNTAASDSAGNQASWNGGNTFPSSGAGLRIHPPGGYGSKVSLGNLSNATAKFTVNYNGWQEMDGIHLYDDYGGNNYNINAIKFNRGGSAVGSIQTNNSATIYNTSSDYRLKENVVPISDAADRLKSLKPSRFNFKIDPTTTVDGFLAHEVSEYVPEAISGEKDAMYPEVLYSDTIYFTADDDIPEGLNVGDVREPADVLPDGKVFGDVKEPSRMHLQQIDQSKLVPLLTAALQSALEKIENLTTRIEALENN